MKKFVQLSKGEMKNVKGGLCDPNSPACNGGTTTCWVTTSGANYTNPSTGVILVDSSNPSAAANSWCVNQIATAGNGVYHCSYNCGTGPAA